MNFVTKQCDQEKWLGDQFHEEGLSQSVEATIKSRTARTKGAIYEVKSILEDFRMQKVGGLIGGFDIWEMAIVQSLLNNAQTWTDMSEESLSALEYLILTSVWRQNAYQVTNRAINLLCTQLLIPRSHWVLQVCHKGHTIILLSYLGHISK